MEPSPVEEKSPFHGVTDDDFMDCFYPPIDTREIAKHALRGEGHSIKRFRRLFWFHFVGAISGNDPVYWLDVIKSHRWTYMQLRDKQQMTLDGLQSLDPQITHPLSDSIKNPWNTIHENEELQNEIWKDVVRTTQAILLRSLYIWSKQNPKISYKQGMNELLGMFVLICYRDRYIGRKADSVCGNLCSVDDIEADAYTLFARLMDLGMKDMFITPDASKDLAKLRNDPLDLASANPTLYFEGSQLAVSSPILRLSFHIFNEVLQHVEPQLYQHLRSLNLEPQLYLLRWIRLLFSREFHLDDSISIWDALLADLYDRTHQNSTLNQSRKGLNLDLVKYFPLVVYFSIAMMKFIKLDLLKSDFGGCLSRLLNFPPVESVTALIQLALKVRSDTSNQGTASSPRSMDSSSCIPLKVNTSLPATAGTRSNMLSLKAKHSHCFNDSDNPKSHHSISLEDGQLLSGKALGIHITHMEEFVLSTLELENSNTVKDELELLLHDLSIFKRILAGDLPYDSQLFVISPLQEETKH
ncbi:TBC domain-containing protein [Cardiosporidium cionae]|uniref:TBC domain-containing protein n=1 Tax=Cardiosporidium cionae TaxID=476202 RepID=A0ABQ7JAS4_9APIC|nr:TBC domain-containing protein [Cardiosporidium cionae]|eukprot:KAF8821079.1 TBC domain-containing protein [Cardiosporidium cionae]